MLGFLLNIISSILKWIFQPFLYLVNSIIALIKGEFNEYNKQLAIAKDQYGNGLGKYLFNFLFIKKAGYRFGNIDETISSVIGKNKRDKTLTKFGKSLDFVLDKLDKNHSIKSIDNKI